MTEIAILKGCPDTINVIEYCVGRARTSVIYPGVQQCITITAYHPHALICTHISPATEDAQMATVYKTMKDWDAQNALTWYVVGNMATHFDPNTPGRPGHRGARWESQADILADLAEYLPEPKIIFLCDTTDMARHIGASYGIDIEATRLNPSANLDFSYRKSSGRRSPSHPIDHTQFTRVIDRSTA